MVGNDVRDAFSAWENIPEHRIHKHGLLSSRRAELKTIWG